MICAGVGCRPDHDGDIASFRCDGSSIVPLLRCGGFHLVHKDRTLLRRGMLPPAQQIIDRGWLFTVASLFSRSPGAGLSITDARSQLLETLVLYNAAREDVSSLCQQRCGFSPIRVLRVKT